jgi:hypothetical protein
MLKPRQEENAYEKLLSYNIELEDALFNVLDGNSRWDEIQYMTGLSKEVCEGISQLFHEICKKKGY